MSQEVKVDFDKDSFEVSINGDTADIKNTDKDAFKNNLPEGLTNAVVKEVFAYNGDFIDSVTDIAATKAGEIFKKNKGVEKVYLTFPHGPTGTGSIKIAAHREKSYPVPGSTDVVKKPALTVAVKHKGMGATKSKVRGFVDRMKDQIAKG